MYMIYFFSEMSSECLYCICITFCSCINIQVDEEWVEGFMMGKIS